MGWKCDDVCQLPIGGHSNINNSYWLLLCWITCQIKVVGGLLQIYSQPLPTLTFFLNDVISISPHKSVLLDNSSEHKFGVAMLAPYAKIATSN